MKFKHMTEKDIILATKWMHPIGEHVVDMIAMSYVQNNIAKDIRALRKKIENRHKLHDYGIEKTREHFVVTHDTMEYKELDELLNRLNELLPDLENMEKKLFGDYYDFGRISDDEIRKYAEESKK